MKKLFAALILSMLGACLPLTAFAATTLPPSCRLSAASASPGVGATVNLSWSSANATRGTITTIGDVGPSGIQGVIPLAPASTYVGTFYGPGGTSTCQISIPVGGVGGSINTGGSIDVGSYGGTTPAPLNIPSNTTSGTNLSGPSSAQSGGGLITCGQNGDAATTCNICTFGSTFQKLLNFAVGFSIPLAAMAFAFAGWLYFSNRENPTQIERAHKIFYSVLVGFILVLMSWLMIQTILKAVAPGYQSWNSWDCKSINRVTTGTIGQLLNPALGTPQQSPQQNIVVSNGAGVYSCQAGWDLAGSQCYNPVNGKQMDATVSSQASSYSCPAGWDLAGDQCFNSVDGSQMDATLSSANYNETGGNRCNTGYLYYPPTDGSPATCYNPDTDTFADPTILVGNGTRGYAQCADGNTNCDISTLQSLGLNDAQANAMSCIAITELSGQSVGCSGTGPCGTFQISRTDWKQYAPSSCQANNFGGNITAAQNNADCNKVVMATMVQARGYQPWTGQNNGVYWNPAARTCVQNYDPANL